VQAQLLNLLRDLRAEFKLTYVFISHDLAVVSYVCDRIGVMRFGVLLEVATRTSFVNDPAHAYTRALRDAVPEVGRALVGEA
jgi:ABC-type oligopeptide transport system ATPase subunit